MVRNEAVSGKAHYISHIAMRHQNHGKMPKAYIVGFLEIGTGENPDGTEVVPFNI